MSYPSKDSTVLDGEGVRAPDATVELHEEEPGSAQDATMPDEAELVRAPDGTPCPAIGKLTVTVYKARGIKGDEWHGYGKADPYAKIQFGTDKSQRDRQTAVAKDKGAHPQWNEAISFYVTKIDSGYNNLSIQLYNKNSISLRKDTLLGHLTIANLGEVLGAQQNSVAQEYYPVFLDGEHKGEILLGLDLAQMSCEQILHAREATENRDVKPPKNDPKSKYKIDQAQVKQGLKIANVVLKGVKVVVHVVAAFSGN